MQGVASEPLHRRNTLRRVGKVRRLIGDCQSVPQTCEANDSRGREFGFPDPRDEFWMPLSRTSPLARQRLPLTARLRPEATPAAAAAELNTLVPRLRGAPVVATDGSNRARTRTRLGRRRVWRGPGLRRRSPPARTCRDARAAGPPGGRRFPEARGSVHRWSDARIHVRSLGRDRAAVRGLARVPADAPGLDRRAPPVGLGARRVPGTARPKCARPARARRGRHGHNALRRRRASDSQLHQPFQREPWLRSAQRAHLPGGAAPRPAVSRLDAPRTPACGTDSGAAGRGGRPGTRNHCR